MQLNADEMLLFRAACADRGNLAAQELLNLFGAESAEKVLESIVSAPYGLFHELTGHVSQAIDEARQRNRFHSRFMIRPLAG